MTVSFGAYMHRSKLNLLLRHDCFSAFSTSGASVATEGMSDKEKEHARIMARLDELELAELEAGSTEGEDDNDDDDAEDDDEDAGTSEDGDENEESGNALNDGNEHHSSSFGPSFSGNGGNDRSHGNIQVPVSQTHLTYGGLVHVIMC